MIDNERLRYRNQFVLAPYYIENLVGWRKIEVLKDLILTVHPDLEVTQHGNSSKSITLLGYVLDPNKVEKINFDIIANLHDKIFKEKRNYFDPTFDFGGRWILIIKDVEDIILFNDAAGLRQVVYSDRKDDKYFWCASQPGLIAKELGLNNDSEALNFIEFIKKRNDEYFMPGNSTPYREINHLLPNHYLNLNKKACHRYWPKDEYIPTKLKEAAERCSHIVEGLMAAASNRFDLCLSLSSGLDSRLVLAGSRKIAKKITFISEVKKDTYINHPDVEIPKKILNKLGLNHDIINFAKDKPIDNRYCEIIKNNVPFFHDKWLAKAITYLELYDLKKVNVNGTISAVAKLHYHKYFKPQQLINNNVAAIKLAELFGVHGNNFGINKIADWLSSIDTIYNYNLLDIFFWELNAGRWAASNNLEFDAGWKDILVPYNCRTLIDVMLSTDKKYRTAPNYILYHKIIGLLWPEILSEPINPHKIKKNNFFIRVKRRVKKELRIINLFTNK